MTRESLVVATLVELADNLVVDFDVIDLLILVSRRCVEVLDVDAAGVMLAAPTGELQFVASSSESMKILELFQIQADEGPCVDSYRSGETVANHALSDPDERWPHFTPRALALGFAAVYSVPLRLRGRTIGALNLFRREPGWLDETDVMYAQGLADIATITILQHQTAVDASLLNDQLTRALESRIVIEQAKGMVAAAMRCDVDQAFARLRTHARNHNLGLTAVAHSVVSGAVRVDELDS